MKLESLREVYDREKQYLDGLTVGSKEYVESFGRLTTLSEQISKLEKTNSDMECAETQTKKEKVEQIVNTALKTVEIVVVKVGLPIVGLVAITATEKETTFRGALRDYTKLFIPRK